MAHAQIEISPSERLLAWHFAYQTREKQGFYSESLRRLQKNLEMDPRTIRRAMARLVDLGLFERIDRSGTHAPIYRLLVSCPFDCEDLDTHNTKQELVKISEQKTLGVSNTPTLESIQTPPYIEIERRRREALSDFKGFLELGWIIQVLESLQDLNSDQLTLKAHTELNPHPLAEIAFNLTEKLPTDKRKKAYLAKIAKQDPNALLKPLEDYLAGLSGLSRLETATKPQPVSPSTIKPETRPSRVLDYARSVFPDWEPSEFVIWYLREHALEGTLDEFELTIARSFEPVLKQAITFLEPPFNTKLAGGVPIELRAEGVYSDWIIGSINPAKNTYLLDEAELEQLKIFAEGIDKLKKEFIERQGEYSPARFYMEPETKAFKALHPQPVSDLELQKRFVDYYQKRFLNFVEGTKERWDREHITSGSNYLAWLEENFTDEDDFKIFLNNFPQREEGSHAKNYRTAYPIWQTARRLYAASDLESLANRYWENLDPAGNETALQYAMLPSNWLTSLINETLTKQVDF